MNRPGDAGGCDPCRTRTAAAVTSSVFFSATLLCSVVAQSIPAAMDLLEYQRESILSGQWWRLFTGHLVHLGWKHLALNLTGIGLLGAIATTQGVNAFAAARTLVVMLGTSIGLLILAPELAWYRGASGVLYGLLLLLSLDLARTWQFAYGVILVLLVKVFYEACYGASLTTGTAGLGGDVITTAHTAGVITAGAVWLTTQLARTLHTLQYARCRRHMH